MPAASGLLAASSAVQGAAAFGSAYTQSKALKAQADFERQQAEANARMADLQAQDAITRGDGEASALRRKASLLQGEQRASLAAQGIDINSGSAGDIQDETQAMAESDIATIKNNAWREAWGFKAQALDIKNRGDNAYMAGQNAASNTLLTGGIQAVGKGFEAASYASKGMGGAKTKTPAKAKSNSAGSSYSDYSNIG